MESSGVLFSSPAPVREREAVSPNPEVPQDERTAAGDFEAGQFNPEGVRSGGGGLYWDNAATTLHGVLIKDVPRLVNYIQNRVQIGDTDNAQKAYNQLVQFTNANADNLNAYSRGKPRNQAQMMLKQRAQSLLNGSAIGEEMLFQLRPENNKKSLIFFKAETEGSDQVYAAQQQVMQNTASNYDRELFNTAKDMATMKNGSHDYRTTGANDLFALGQAAKGVFQKEFGKDIPDAQARALAGLTRVLTLTGRDENSRMSVLSQLIQLPGLYPPDAPVSQKIDAVLAAGRGLDRALSNEAVGVQGIPLSQLGHLDYVGTALARYAQTRKGVAASPDTITEEVAVVTANTAKLVFEGGWKDAAGMLDTLSEIAVNKSVPSQVRRPLSAKANLYINLESSREVLTEKVAGKDAVKRHLISPVIDAATRELQESAVRGDLPKIMAEGVDVKNLLSQLLSGDRTGGVSLAGAGLDGGVSAQVTDRVFKVVEAAAEDQAQALVKLMPEISVEDAKVFTISLLLPPRTEATGLKPEEVEQDKFLTGLKGSLDAGALRRTEDPANFTLRANTAAQDLVNLGEAADVKYAMSQARTEQERASIKFDKLNNNPGLSAAFKKIENDPKVKSRADLGPEFNSPELIEAARTLAQTSTALSETQRVVRDTMATSLRDYLGSKDVKPKVEALQKAFVAASTDEKVKLRRDYEAIIEGFLSKGESNGVDPARPWIQSLVGGLSAIAANPITKAGVSLATLGGVPGDALEAGANKLLAQVPGTEAERWSAQNRSPLKDALESADLTPEGQEALLAKLYSDNAVVSMWYRDNQARVRVPKEGDPNNERVVQAGNLVKSVVDRMAAVAEGKKKESATRVKVEKTRRDQMLSRFGVSPEKDAEIQEKFQKGKAEINIEQRRERALSWIAMAKKRTTDIGELSFLDQFELDVVANDWSVLNLDAIVNQRQTLKDDRRIQVAAKTRAETTAAGLEAKAKAEGDLPPEAL